MEDFIKDNLEEIEVLALEEWCQDSYDIKQYMWELSNDSLSRNFSEAIFGMFNKYKSNVEEKTILYRGMSIPDKIFFAMGYDLLKKGSFYTPDDKAITSFTKSNRIAYEFARDGYFNNKVVIRVESHGDEMFDISSISSLAAEEETILMKNLWYNVKRVKRYDNGGEKWLILILEKL